MPGRAAILFSAFLTLAFCTLTLFNPAVIDGFLENLLVDYRFRVRNLVRAPAHPEDVCVVAIDERSLAEHGRWPWDRRVLASLLERVLSGRPRAVGLDIFFPESESPESDAVLGALFEQHRDRLVVALGFEVEKNRPFRGEIPEPLYPSAIPRLVNLSAIWPVEACRVLLPPESLSRAATFGHVYSLPDRDGRLRWETLYLRYGEEFFPSLALQVARLALSVSLDDLAVLGGQGVGLGRRLLPADDFGRLAINYYGREGSVPYLSAAAVLSGEVSPVRFENRVVLVGTSAIATYDIKSSPFSANLPGVEKNATVVDNILRGLVLRRGPLAGDLLVILAIGVFLAWTAPRFRAVVTLGALVAGVLVVSLGNLLLFVFLRVEMNLFYPLAMLVAGGGSIVSYRYFREEERAKQVRRMFSSYVTERVVNELIRNPQMTRLGGERREITVLFSDIRGFTTFSESQAPEQVVHRLNEFLQAMTEVIFRWEGTLDKFVGDEIVAFWGAPLLQENHAELAFQCALNMMGRLGELQEDWRSRGQTVLDIGIGINTGEVIVGNIGAEGKKMEYTVIGDHVNLGARIEALTRRFEAHILTTEYTLEKIRSALLAGRLGPCEVTGLGRVIVKGKDQAVGLYEIRPLAPGQEPTLTESGEERTLRFEEK